MEDPKWTQQSNGRRLHICPDGIAGSEGEYDELKPETRPLLPQTREHERKSPLPVPARKTTDHANLTAYDLERIAKEGPVADMRYGGITHVVDAGPSRGYVVIMITQDELFDEINMRVCRRIETERNLLTNPMSEKEMIALGKQFRLWAAQASRGEDVPDHIKEIVANLIGERTRKRLMEDDTPF
jgi:hypothetical protein